MDLSKKFISQDEIEDVKKRRQEEWEKKRTPDQPLECPDEVVDNRCLYDKLEEQKLKKKEEEEEKYRLKNCVKGLADEEVTFLDFVSQRQMEIEKARSTEEARILEEIRNSSVSTVPAEKTSEDKKPKPQNPTTTTTTTNKRSQQALLAGAVKRKSTENEESKKRKLSQDDNSKNAENTDDRLSAKISDSPTTDKLSTSNNQAAKIVGILPGLGAYNNDTSDSESSSSESEMEFKIMPPKKIVLHFEDE